MHTKQFYREPNGEGDRERTERGFFVNDDDNDHHHNDDDVNLHDDDDSDNEKRATIGQHSANEFRARRP